MEPFSELREFYRRLEEFLPGPDLPPSGPAPGPSGRGNGCGSCGDCCRWFFYLSGHEWRYIEHHLRETGRPVPARFQRAVTPEEDERLSQPEARCPLYAEGQGCTVYPARPLACRLAGPYLPVHSRLPGHCVFTRPRRYATCEEIPLWEEYVKVLRAHPSPPGYIAPLQASPPPPGPGLRVAPPGAPSTGPAGPADPA